jgi:hypothetical protein
MPSWISGDDEAHCQNGCQETRSSGAHRAALDVPVNHDAVAAAAAFMGCSGSAWEVALPDGSVREPSGFCPGKVSWSSL